MRASAQRSVLDRSSLCPGMVRTRQGSFLRRQINFLAEIIKRPRPAASTSSYPATGLSPGARNGVPSGPRRDRGLRCRVSPTLACNRAVRSRPGHAVKLPVRCCANRRSFHFDLFNEFELDEPRRLLIEPIAAVAHPVNVDGEPSRAEYAGFFA